MFIILKEDLPLKLRNSENKKDFPNIFEALKTSYRTDWLCALEILEIVYHTQCNFDLEKKVRIYLEMKAASEQEITKLINDGLHVIANPVTQLIIEEN
jgi:phenylalanine-4-hydroxylase